MKVKLKYAYYVLLNNIMKPYSISFMFIFIATPNPKKVNFFYYITQKRYLIKNSTQFIKS